MTLNQSDAAVFFGITVISFIIASLLCLISEKDNESVRWGMVAIGIAVLAASFVSGADG